MAISLILPHWQIIEPQAYANNVIKGMAEEGTRETDQEIKGGKFSQAGNILTLVHHLAIDSKEQLWIVRKLVYRLKD